MEVKKVHHCEENSWDTEKEKFEKNLKHYFDLAFLANDDICRVATTMLENAVTDDHEGEQILSMLINDKYIYLRAEEKGDSELNKKTADFIKNILIDHPIHIEGVLKKLTNMQPASVTLFSVIINLASNNSDHPRINLFLLAKSVVSSIWVYYHSNVENLTKKIYVELWNLLLILKIIVAAITNSNEKDNLKKLDSAIFQNDVFTRLVATVLIRTNSKGYDSFLVPFWRDCLERLPNTTNVIAGHISGKLRKYASPEFVKFLTFNHLK